MDAALQDLVPRRARFRCEYCLLPEALVSTPFQFDHIIAQSHGGQTSSRAIVKFRKLSSRRDTMRIARRFNAGIMGKNAPRPEGTVEHDSDGGWYSRPFGTQLFGGLVPGVETPGYSRAVPPGHRFAG